MRLHYIIENEPDEYDMEHSYAARNYKPVGFYFDVDVDFDDFFEYMQPDDFKSWHEEEKKAFKIACEKVWNSNWFYLNDIEEDEDFIEFMKNKCEEDALDAFFPEE